MPSISKHPGWQSLPFLSNRYLEHDPLLVGGQPRRATIASSSYSRRKRIGFEKQPIRTDQNDIDSVQWGKHEMLDATGNQTHESVKQLNSNSSTPDIARSCLCRCLCSGTAFPAKCEEASCDTFSNVEPFAPIQSILTQNWWLICGMCQKLAIC